MPRWGTTSFDVEYVGTVDGGACFDGLVTYVSVDAETRRPTPVPRDLKGSPERHAFERCEDVVLTTREIMNMINVKFSGIAR